MLNLVDQFCPNVHDAPITAADYDPISGTVATGDADGTVALQRSGEVTPQLIFKPGVGITGAVRLLRGGTMVAVGDDDGTVGVYKTDSGAAIFQEIRDGARGRVRAMRGVAISPEGGRLAAIAVDGLLRVWDMNREDRQAWRGFSGDTVEFDPRGERLLAMDEEGQPKLMDLRRVEAIYMDRLQTPAERACFTRDGTMVVAAGPAGISLLRVVDGALVASFATRGGSGIKNLVLNPEGNQVAAVTERSAHLFSLPDLQPVESRKHGAPQTTGAAFWSNTGLRVGGSDGLMHSGGATGAGPVQAVGGFGDTRLAAHQDRIGVWTKNQRVRELAIESELREIHVDRDGRLAVAVPMRGPVQILDLSSGKVMMDCGPESSGSSEIGVGGTVVAIQLKRGGCRWWDLAQNRGFELKWPTAMSLSGGGTWLGVVTPKGAVRILDPSTGKDAVLPPTPLAEVPIRLLAFVNRRPDMLVLDQDGVLGHYDLGASVRDSKPGEGRDVLTINVEVDRMWGITGGQYCALRLPEQDGSSTVLWVDVHACEVAYEVRNLHRFAWVDAENGLILEPARAGAILEREKDGRERRVLRSLPDNQWICFGSKGILDASEGAASSLS